MQTYNGVKKTQGSMPNIAGLPVRIANKEKTLEYRELLKRHPEIVNVLKNTNPNYGFVRYNTNYQRCVPTSEAIRRGENVKAKEAAALFDNISNDITAAWENIEARIAERGKERQTIEAYMEGLPDGARLEIEIHTGIRGHVFIAEKIENNTYYYDTQSGRFGVEKYFDLIGGEKRTKYIRIDDAELSEEGRNSFKRAAE